MFFNPKYRHLVKVPELCKNSVSFLLAFPFSVRLKIVSFRQLIHHYQSKAVDMNEYILKLIVGHAVEDITEKTYSHRTIEGLHRGVQKIK